MPPLHLTLRQLQVFACIARRGSTAAAAPELALSQSATSSALTELERLLGHPLFDRVGRGLQINEQGRTLLPQALATLDSARTIERLSRGQGLHWSTVRLGASTTLGNHIVPALLARWSAEDTPPALPDKVRIANTADICQAVAMFELDVGLIEGPCHHPMLEVQPWLDDELRVVAAADSPAARQGAIAPLSAAQLRKQRWLVREAGSGTRESTDHLLLPHLHHVPLQMEFGSSEAIREAVVLGLGIACLSRWVVQRDLDQGRIVSLPTRLPPLKRPCAIVTHRARQQHPLLQMLHQRLRALDGIPTAA